MDEAIALGVVVVRITKAAFEAAHRLVIRGSFASPYQAYQVGLRQCASSRRIITPGTLGLLPPSDEPKTEFARTYLPREEHEFVQRQLRGSLGPALDAWLQLVDRRIPASGTAGFMAGHVHRGPPPQVTWDSLGMSPVPGD